MSYTHTYPHQPAILLLETYASEKKMTLDLWVCGFRICRFIQQQTRNVWEKPGVVVYISSLNTWGTKWQDHGIRSPTEQHGEVQVQLDYG